MVLKPINPDGIDVSRYQGNIDWKEVSKSSTIKFAFIRINGYDKDTLTVDINYKYNLEKSREYGLLVGIYVYSKALTEEDAINEANSINNILNNTYLDLPIWYDIEYSQQSKLGRTSLSNIIVTFYNTMLKFGYLSGLYTSLNWLRNYIDYNIIVNNNIPIWVAQYNNELSIDSSIVSIWQYSDRGNVNGINTNVDLNKCIVNLSELNNRCAKIYNDHNKGNWIYENSTNKWWYKHSDGSYTISNIEIINDSKYYFDNKGYMVQGWFKLNENWYYAEESGKIKKDGWVFDKSTNKYYYIKDEIMVSDVILIIGGLKYSFANDGHMERTTKNGNLI